MKTSGGVPPQQPTLPQVEVLPRYIAAENGFVEFCRTLLESAELGFSKLYERNTDGLNALLVAAKRGYVGVCEFFVADARFKYETEIVDRFGNNAFLYACAAFRFAEDLQRLFFDNIEHPKYLIHS